jgi:transketolase
VGINDTFGCSGHNYAEVLEYHGLTKEHIMEAVKSIIE